MGRGILFKQFSRFGTLFFALIGAFLFFSAPAHAAPDVVVKDSAYSAKFVSQSIADPVVLEEGETKTVTITFKNTGTATWDASKSRFLSAYTMEPRNRLSAFKGTNWKSTSQTVAIGGIVKPGETGKLELTLSANAKPGTYTEHFYLAAENHSWVKGGYFYVKVQVVAKKASVSTPTTVNTGASSNTLSAGILGKRIGLNTSAVSVKGGEQVKLIVIYQNLSKTAWSSYGLVPGSTSGLAGETSVSFLDESWVSASSIVKKDQTVAPGASFRETFYFRAPKTVGVYTANFRVQADGGFLDDMISVNVNVTENAPVHDATPLLSDPSVPSPVISVTPRLLEEPRIRVGLQSLDDAQAQALQFVSYDDDYRVWNGETVAGVLPATHLATMQYTEGVYSFKGGGVSFRTNNRIRLEPVNNQHASFTLMNFDRSMAWAGHGKFNRYRGALEYVRGQVDQEMYAVNDLLLEDYVKGIRETGTTAPIEMIKANLVAARTYAYLSKGKYPLFDVLGSTYDQLYLGADSESVGNVVAAADATRGIMVTYEGHIVTTPYFGNSNGNTRSWSSVWGGANKPWLVPVRAEYDAGRAQFGHGVGMSQRDAAIRADKEGSTWDQLLKHYYTGVELERIYQ